MQFWPTFIVYAQFGGKFFLEFIKRNIKNYYKPFLLRETLHGQDFQGADLKKRPYGLA